MPANRLIKYFSEFLSSGKFFPKKGYWCQKREYFSFPATFSIMAYSRRIIENKMLNLELFSGRDTHCNRSTITMSPKYDRTGYLACLQEFFYAFGIIIEGIGMGKDCFSESRKVREKEIIAL